MAYLSEMMSSNDQTISEARERKLPLRRIDGIDCARRDQFLGKGAVAAADFDPVHALRRIEPIEKNPPSKLAPAAHHPLVSFAVGEHFAGVCHRIRLARSIGWAVLLKVVGFYLTACALDRSAAGQPFCLMHRRVSVVALLRSAVTSSPSTLSRE
jgi:hypothetical protein